MRSKSGLRERGKNQSETQETNLDFYFLFLPSDSFLDRAAYFAQVFSKGVVRVGCAFFHVSRELQLLPQRLPAFDCVSLASFALPNFLGNSNQLVNLRRRDKQTAVVVGEHNVARFDQEFAKTRRTQASESRGSSRCGPDGQVP